ncbi:MAG: hypothetical protein EPN45_16210 [Rhizobiaceae bacterium]|nr:MAG: hypothetical protein EPN45_16210 [Rhizobiaceae bacterium]
MNAPVVKFPSKLSSEPNHRFCGLCGRRVYPFLCDNIGFGPCIDERSNAVDCRDLQHAIVGAVRMAEKCERTIHPEWTALIARLGLPQVLIDEWLAKAERAASIRDQIRLGEYGAAGGLPFMRALSEWVAAGDADEKIIALVEALKVHCDPTAGGTKPVSMLDIMDWFERLGERAKDILSDPGDWEMAE